MNLEKFGAWYENLARYQEAEEIFRQVIELEKQLLPSRHGDMLRVAAGIFFLPSPPLTPTPTQLPSLQPKHTHEPSTTQSQSTIPRHLFTSTSLTPVPNISS